MKTFSEKLDSLQKETSVAGWYGEHKCPGVIIPVEHWDYVRAYVIRKIPADALYAHVSADGYGNVYLRWTEGDKRMDVEFDFDEGKIYCSVRDSITNTYSSETEELINAKVPHLP